MAGDQSGSATPSLSPSKSAAGMDTKIKQVVRDLNMQWDLELELPDPNDSPSKRAKSTKKTCFENIRYLTFKSAIDVPLRRFQVAAEQLYSGWVIKPKAERGVVPAKTRHNFHPISSKERAELLQRFIDITAPIKQTILEQDVKKARTPGKHSFTGMATEPLNDKGLKLDFSRVSKPIPRSKRSSEELNGSGNSKRSRKSVDDMRDEDHNPFIKPARPGPTDIFSRVPSESSIPPGLERGRQTSQTNRRRSANTSFASSHQSSIFDRSAEMPATQETVPDPDPRMSNAEPDAEPETQSSEIFGSSFDPSMCEVLGELDNIVQKDIAQTNPESFDDFKKDDEQLSAQEKTLRDRLVRVFRMSPILHSF
jgi:hypothetical protein